MAWLDHPMQGSATKRWVTLEGSIQPRCLTPLSWWGGASKAHCVLRMKHQRNIVAIQTEMADASLGHTGPSPLSALQRARSPRILQTPRPPPLPVIRGIEEPVQDLRGCGFCMALHTSSRV